MKVKGGGDPAGVDIDMTPMIDIVFQLITFFMVIINFEAADADERVRMAISDLARPPKVKPEAELTLQLGYDPHPKTGKIDLTQPPVLFYNGLKVPINDFDAKLKTEVDAYRLAHPTGGINVTVILRADKDCPAGEVQRLIKKCQEKGYEKFALKAMQPDE